MVIQTRTDQHMYVPDDLKCSLQAYAAAEKERMDNPLIKEMITWKSLALHIIRNEVTKRGYYIPSKKEVQKYD